LTWSLDGRWIAMNWSPAATGGTRLAKIRVGAGEPSVLSEQGCGFLPSWSPDSSRILCSAGGVLYTMPAEGGRHEFLDKVYEPIACWSREMRYIYAIRKMSGKRQLGRLDLNSGVFQPITEIPADWTFNTPILGGVRLSLSADGKRLATTLARRTGDIWILEGFQPPPTLWQRLLRR
jgi:hypothetical protein